MEIVECGDLNHVSQESEDIEEAPLIQDFETPNVSIELNVEKDLSFSSNDADETMKVN